MIINTFDLGTYQTNADLGVTGTIGTQLVEGTYTAVWHRGAGVRKRQETVFVQSQVALGGFAAKSRQATQYLLTQLLQLASNRDLQPCFVQFASGAGTVTTDPRDGWYVLDSVKPVNEFPWSGIVQVQIDMTLVATAPPRSMAMQYQGSALASNYNGAASILMGYPLNSTIYAPTTLGRTGGEGSIPGSVNPSASTNPLPFGPSATITDWFKGDCSVYDTINTASNGVPAAPTFLNANWVEVLAPDHRFEGDCWITNGLIGMLLQVGQARVAQMYVWSTGLATAGWQLFGTHVYADNAIAAGTLRSYTFRRIGQDEVQIVTISATSAGNFAEITYRLQRLMFFVRVNFRPLSQSNSSLYSMYLTLPANPKIHYGPSKIADNGLDNPLSVATDYGYGACFVNSATYPFLTGWLYQNQPAAQPQLNNSASISLGDSSGPAQNATRSYGIFVIPYGTSTTTTDKIQNEAESGVLSGGAVSAADAGSSGGNAAKIPNGNAATFQIIAGTAFVPLAGTYGIWVRLRVTSIASATVAVRFYLYDTNTAGAASALFSPAPNALATTYAWYLIANGVTPAATHQMQFKVDAAGPVCPTDYWIDEFAMVPETLTTSNLGPQEIWQQFMHDRSVRLVRT